LLYLIEYIHNNPVRRGLVANATDIENTISDLTCIRFV